MWINKPFSFHYIYIVSITYLHNFLGNPTIDKIVSLNNRVAREGVAITESPFVVSMIKEDISISQTISPLDA